MNIRFIFVGEGSSDAALVKPLEDLCLDVGAIEVVGIAPDLSLLRDAPGRDVGSKVEAALRLEPDIDLVFIHRDANGVGREARRREIDSAMEPHDVPYVPVIPKRTTEAWALLDEERLRFLAGNPNGSVPLSLPASPAKVEELPDPKQQLFDALTSACELTGGRLKRFKRDLRKYRTQLVEAIRVGDAIENVPAWQSLRRDLTDVLTQLEL